MIQVGLYLFNLALALGGGAVGAVLLRIVTGHWIWDA